MQQLVLIIHVLIAVILIALVLLQQGKGSDVGAAFGSGASNTMFGSAGSTPFLVKVIALFLVLFFITSISLTYLVNDQYKNAAAAEQAAPNPFTQTIPGAATVPQPKTSIGAHPAAPATTAPTPVKEVSKK